MSKKCKCCGNWRICKCDGHVFKVGQYVRTTREYSDSMTKSKAHRGRIIHLQDRSDKGESPLATIKIFFGGKVHLDTSWLREPFNGKEDAFYESEIKDLEEQLLVFKEELAPAQREYIKNLENKNRRLEKKVARLAVKVEDRECRCHFLCCCEN